MNLSPMVAEWVATYEQELGHRPTELSIQVAERIMKVSDILREIGRRDGQKGEKAYPDDVFPSLVVKAFRLDPNTDTDEETVQAVADLWRSDYMAGYNAWKEACNA